MTTTTAEDRSAAIARARAEANPDDIIAGVKAVVGEEIRQLSPDASVVATSYFNHTYMPDFVIEWKDRGRETQRPVFIRNQITETSASREVEALGDREPVLLGLDPVGEDGVRAAVRESVGFETRMLVSDVASMGALGQPLTSEASPLLSLVRSNILRGGKGLFVEEQVQAVVDSASLDPGDGEADRRLDAFSIVAATLFEEAAATRLLRAAEILRLALTTRDGDPILASIDGELSASDLRVLLPYLLERQADVTNGEFWAYIGSMMSLSRLEELSDALSSVSIAPLVRANLSAWLGKRAQLGLNAAFDDEADDGETTNWSFNAGLLTAVVGRYLISLASDARRLKGREGGIVPSWRDTAPLVAGYALDQVDLRGVVRRIRLSAEESGDVARDVARINKSLEDSYSVHYISVHPVGSESSMWVDFAGSTITGEGPTPLNELTDAAIRFLAHRRPVEPERIASLFDG